MARDDFTQQIKDVLAQRVNCRCSNPLCRAPTSGPRVDTKKSLSVGVAAHISAASAGGPRFQSEITSEDRRSIANGIWLCQTCARLVDSDEERFTTSILRDWRQKAETYAEERVGRPDFASSCYPVVTTTNWHLQRESNSRFGFSFVHPFTWDREDPGNSDGNKFRHPTDPQVEMAAWGGYAVISPDLHSWVDRTIIFLGEKRGFQLLSRVAAGGHIFDWDEDETSSKVVETRMQIEGHRIVYAYEEDGIHFTAVQTFLQYGITQIGLACRAPTDRFKSFEELFLVAAKDLRILGSNSAPFARGTER
jgi:hypothetical protein